MRTVVLILAASAVIFAQQKAGTQEKTMTIKRLTPNLYVDNVAECAKFWTERLHFQKTAEVPEEGGGLAFVALNKGGIEVMYGSYASLDREPLAGPNSYKKGTSYLFIEVDNLDEVVAVMKDVPKIADVHKTFYGSTELTVKDPAGNFITFAQFGKQ
jgi:uncharacterized glyoxalase superfamily protein PhnB